MFQYFCYLLSILLPKMYVFHIIFYWKLSTNKIKSRFKVNSNIFSMIINNYAALNDIIKYNQLHFIVNSTVD